MDNKDLIKLSKKISKFVVGFEGNVSKKIQDSITIKASGKKLSEITNEDFVTYDLNLKQLNNFNLKGSMELDFHHFILNKFESNYVCHTHPSNTLKILCSKNSNEFINFRLFPDQVIFNGVKYCFVPYEHPGIKLKNSIEYEINKWFLEYDEPPKVIFIEAFFIEGRLVARFERNGFFIHQT